MKKIIVSPPKGDRALKSKRSTTPARMEEQSESPLVEKTPRVRVVQKDHAKMESKAKVKRAATSPLIQHLMDKRRRTSTDTNSSTDERKSQLPNGPSQKVKLKVDSSSEQGIDADKKNAINLINDSKDTLASEMRRLATTQGFWSSKTTSRSNSPVAASEQGDGLLVSKSLSSSRKNSKNSTPDVSPSPSRRKSKKIKKQQEEIEELSKLNVPANELKRLKTTDGFAYPIFSPSGLRPSSRDVSPSSTSSLERIGRQIARSHASNEDKSLLGNLENSTPLTKNKRGRPKGKVNSPKKLVKKSGKTNTSSTSNEDVTQTLEDSNPLAKLTSYSLMGSEKSVRGRPKNKILVLGKSKKTKMFSDNALNDSGNIGASPVLSDIATPSTNIDLSSEMEKSSGKTKAGRGRPKLKKDLQGKSPLPVETVASGSDTVAPEAIASNSPVSHLAGVSELLNDTQVRVTPPGGKAKRGRPRKLSLPLDADKSTGLSGAAKKVGRPKIVKDNVNDSADTPISIQEALELKSLSLIKLDKAKQLKRKNSLKKQRQVLALTDGNQGRLKMKRSGKKAVAAKEIYGVRLYKATKGRGKKTNLKDNTAESVNDELKIVEGPKKKMKKKIMETVSTEPSPLSMDPNLVEMQSVEPIMGESIVKPKPKKIRLPKTLKQKIVSRLGGKSLGLKGKMRKKLPGIELQVKHKKILKKRMTEKHGDAVKHLDQLTELSRLTELKRLNTTVGFWSSPDVSTDVLVRRSKQVKMSEAKAKHGKKPKKPLAQLSFSKPISPKKPESSLLQHRKKKLSSLKHNLKKGKVFPNSDLLSNEVYSNTKSKRQNTLEDPSFQPKPATPEVLEIKKKRRGKNLLELESFLSISSQVEARRKGKSLTEDKSLELLQKIESETVARVDKQIEETECLIREDAKALEDTNMCSTDPLEERPTDLDKNITADFLKEDGDAEQFCQSGVGNEDIVTEISSEHNKTLTSISAGKDEGNGNVLIPESLTFTTVMPETEDAGVCETNIASVTLCENIMTLTESHSLDQHSQSKPSDLVVTDVIQTPPQNLKLVSESGVSVLDDISEPDAKDLPDKSHDDVDVENSESCATLSNVPSEVKEVGDASLTAAEIVLERGEVFVGVDSLNTPDDGNVENRKEILGCNSEDAPLCVDTGAQNVLMPLKAAAVELDEKSSVAELPIDDEIQVGAIDEKTLNERSQDTPAPGENGDISMLSGVSNALSSSKETTDMAGLVSTLSDVEIPVLDPCEGLASAPDLSHFEGIVLNKHKKRRRMKTSFYRYKKHRLTEMRQKRLSALYGEAQESSSIDSDNITDSLPPSSVAVLENEEIYPKDPLRKVRKRRRNVWRKGVVKKPAYVAKKVCSKQQVASSQTADQLVLPQLEESETAIKEASSAPSVLEASKTGLNSAKQKNFAMLRRLQTNANLANAVLDESTIKGRFLRKQPPQSITSADGKTRRERSKARVSGLGLPGGLLQQLTVEIPDETKPKKRGRPRKLSASMPKLTPTDIDSPNSNSNISWSQAPPPGLTPQYRTSPKPEEELFNLFGKADNNAPPDTEFVAESVDETDLHLYLSGVSDEDLSPSKESSVVSLEVNPKPQEFVPVIPTDGDTTKLDLPVDNEAPTLIISPSIIKDKDLKKTGKTKMKGKKGKPPGIPMTEEEKSRKGRKSKSSSPVVSPSLYQDYDLFKRPRTARKSMKNSNMYSPPISGQTSASGSTFSLRKKSTRSPLEMLEMKRRQEEAIYDLEEERRQARRILLREKRYARESGDGFSDDGEVLDEVHIKPCSVMLSDFVKKLQLDNIDSPSENDEEDDDADSTIFSSPTYNLVDDQDDEDWCANLEDFEDVDDDEGLVKEKHDRPYKPRLKLKRVMKKNKLFRIRRKNPSSGSPKATQEPIKLVIKAEPILDSGAPGYKATMDLSKVERTGFEGSYLDFLKCKSNDEKRKSSVKKKSYIAAQLSPKEDKDNKKKEGKSQNIVSSPPKVPSLLIAPGMGLVRTVGQCDGSPVLVASQSNNESPVKETPLTNSPKVPLVSELSKNLSLGEEEEEDLLILDLEEGAQDQNSSGSFKDSPITENADAERPTVVAKNALVFENNATHSTISEPLSHVQRTRSNDEMGLMLASYNGFDNPSAGSNQLKSVTEEKVPDLTSESQCVDGENDAALRVTKPGNINKISANISTFEPLKDISKEKVSHKKTCVMGQVDVSVLTTAIVSEDDQMQVGVTVLNGSVNSPDNNNVMVPAKSPSSLLSEPIKKTGNVNENSISPRQITQTGSKSDEWRVKVILQSDKLPSGKYKCKRCDYKSSEKLSIESHIYSHIPGVQFRCAYCDSEFSSMTATWSHLKNVHAISEAKLCISRHIEEKCFYEKEDVVFSEDNTHTSSSQPTNINPGGQSPPVIISVLVSGTVNASRSARSGAPRRFVCTHCGFSTNVKEDAEHHTSDLHKSHNLFACLLCNENIFSSEAEIKQHSAAVHPKRQRTYGKLPDFYDAEQLNSKGKSPNQEERDNIFERMSSIFQGDETQQETNAIDHHQKAKDYLYLQEEWKEKTRVEADSTTAVDFMEDTLAEPSTAGGQLLVDGSSTGEEKVSENEVSVDEVCMKSSKQLSCDADITSSAAAMSVTTEISEKRTTPTLAGATPISTSSNEVNIVAQDTDALGESISSANLASTCTQPSKNQEDASLADGEDVSSDDCMGLKIVQVVSLSQQNESATGDSELAECFKAVGQEHIKQTTGDTTDQGLSDQMKTSSKPKEDEPQSTQARPVAPAKEVVPDNTNNQPQAKDTEQPGSSAQMPASGHTSTSSSFACGLPLSYKCNACRVHTPYLLMMVKHLKAKHPNMRCFACPYCKATHSFISQKQLRLHVRNSHPDKIGRNEIALSEEAKKFVEAMVLPNSPECIRVGNRVVLEEDIHTCTYCQVKMTSLANVYEHLNSKHSDLFEFVCPVCQNFKSKVLSEIAIHCMQAHKSSLDTDKVHVSVPKNLFTVLTCISKGGKYIEKSLHTSEDNASKSAATPAGTSSDVQLTSEVGPKAPNPQPAHQTIVDSPLSLQRTLSSISTPAPAAVEPFVGPVSQSIPQMTLLSQTPLIAIPIVSGSIGGIPSVSTTRPLIAFSSSLFDTSSLTSPPQLIMSSASKPTSVIQSTAGAASFLSPSPSLQPLTKSNPPTKPSSQQPGPRKKSSKSLPVLNIPTIKPRANQPSLSTTPGRPSHEVSIAPSPTPAPPAAHHSSQTGVAFKAPVVDNLPENEPSPDAFKIFNLRPMPQPSPTSMAPPANPIVFPPVSTPISSAFIQGPLAGFPANMVLPPNLMTQYAFSQPLMHPQKLSVPPSQASKHIRPTLSSTPSAAPVSSPIGGSFPSHGTSSAQFGKKNQPPRDPPLLKDQRYELQRQLLLQQQKQTHTSAPLSHQTAKSGHFHITSHPPSSHTFSQVPASVKHKELSHSSPLPSASSSSPSESMARPVKGVHKRSSSIYQCPYCPTLVILKPLEVASHIQQLHPGHQVAFKKWNFNRGDH